MEIDATRLSKRQELAGEQRVQAMASHWRRSGKARPKAAQAPSDKSPKRGFQAADRGARTWRQT